MNFTYYFSGMVLPERADVNFSGLKWLEISQPDSDLSFRLNLQIYKSQISATAKSNKKIDDIITLKNCVHSTVSFFVDSLGFDLGCGYNIEITKCTFNGGDDVVIFGVNIDALKKEENKWVSALAVLRASQEANEVQQIQLQRALSDFKNGILISNDTGFYAYRAIEAIKTAFDDSWDKMNQSLKIARNYTEDLRVKHGNPQRHGNTTFMTSEDRIDMLLRAKNIISRYVTYLNNGNNDLNSDEFAILK